MKEKRRKKTKRLNEIDCGGPRTRLKGQLDLLQSISPPRNNAIHSSSLRSRVYIHIYVYVRPWLTQPTRSQRLPHSPDWWRRAIDLRRKERSETNEREGGIARALSHSLSFSLSPIYLWTSTNFCLCANIYTNICIFVEREMGNVIKEGREREWYREPGVYAPRERNDGKSWLDWHVWNAPASYSRTSLLLR